MKRILALMLILCATPCLAEESYEKLIVGKWRLSHLTGFSANGEELKAPPLSENCFVVFEPSKHERYGAGDCADNYIEKWIITNKTLVLSSDGEDVEYEILQLDDSTLKTKLTKKHGYGTVLHTYEKVTR